MIYIQLATIFGGILLLGMGLERRFGRCIHCGRQHHRFPSEPSA
jgi:hypothetical protein